MKTSPCCLVAALLLSACGPAELRERQTEVLAHSGAVSNGAALSFGSDWTQTSAGLLAGAGAKVVYASSRLPSCRGPQWGITAFWSVNGLPPQSLPVAGAGTSATPSLPPLPLAGDLSVWFQNTDSKGCSAYDSSFGSNYHFSVAAPKNAPGWMGNAGSIIDRETCPSGSFNRCSGGPTPLAAGFSYDTWARQRAGFARVFFEVWQAGVTDFANPNLWQQLDVELHSRVGDSGPFAMSYVSFAESAGNNARYALDLRGTDLLPGLNGGALSDKSQCPSFPVTVSADRQYIDADFQYYFTVNGVGIQPPGGGVFHGRFENYLGLYAVCGY